MSRAPLAVVNDRLSVLAPLDPGDRDAAALISDRFTWTFGELAQRVEALALRLRAKGIATGHRAALRALATPEVFVAIHTLASLGVTLVPLHPRLSPIEVQTLLDVTRPDHVLDDGDLALADPGDLAAERDVRCASVDRGPLPAFAIVATSGTTGTPKGAVLSRGAFLASAEASARNLGWDPQDRWLLCMPLAHVGGLSIVTRCLIARRAVVMLPRFDATLVLDAIRRHRVTLLSVVPTMLRALLDADRDGALALPRAILLGGAAAPPALLQECARRGARALTTYGLTEACSQVTSQSPRTAIASQSRRSEVASQSRRSEIASQSPRTPIASQSPGSEVASQAPRPAESAPQAASDLDVTCEGWTPPAQGDTQAEPDSGAPLHGFEVRIAGPESDAPLPTGAVGRILVRGPALFEGYLVAGRCELDRGPVASGFFDTGDLGSLDERGCLHVQARRADLIVTGGENVYPVEVERAIEAFPGIRRAAVFGVPDDTWGQIVAAAIEPDPGCPFEPKGLVDHLSTTLAPHKRPRRIALVEELPLTGSGKLARGLLLERCGALLRAFP